MTTATYESTTSTTEPEIAVAIRPATAADYEAASGLFRSTMGESFTLNQELWSDICTAETHRALAAEDETGTVIGIAVVVVSDRIRLAAGTHRRRFHIDELIVLPEKRQHGIGRAMLEYIKAMAAKEAPSYIIVNCVFTNVGARRLYEAAGMYLVRQSNDRFEIAFS
jgi:ribosomal protein S18 acetylase RimI-like enzyme